MDIIELKPVAFVKNDRNEAIDDNWGDILSIIELEKTFDDSCFDGTPVLDIKPVFSEFLPEEKLAQPQWSVDLMKNYW